MRLLCLKVLPHRWSLGLAGHPSARPPEVDPATTLGASSLLIRPWRSILVRIAGQLISVRAPRCPDGTMLVAASGVLGRKSVDGRAVTRQVAPLPKGLVAPIGTVGLVRGAVELKHESRLISQLLDVAGKHRF
jgi:hypothetical protein